jgi:hypothetical protein
MTRKQIWFMDRSDHFWLAVGLLSIGTNVLGRVDNRTVHFLVGLVVPFISTNGVKMLWLRQWLTGWARLGRIRGEDLMVSRFACTMIGLHFKVLESLKPGNSVDVDTLVGDLKNLVVSYESHYQVKHKLALGLVELIVDDLNAKWANYPR